MLLASPCAMGQKISVILNNSWKGTISMTVNDGIPCLSRPLMEEWGVITPLLERLEWDAQACLLPSSAHTFSLNYEFLPQASKLLLNFPDAAFNPQQNGVSTSRWDDGINALFMNYRLDVDKRRARYSWDTSGTDSTLTLENGLNLGPWRLRYQNAFWRERDGGHGSYTSGYSLWRSLQSLRARLTLGDGYTSSNLFDSMPYRGVSLASDSAMLPDRWRAWTPVINGYARGEAEVTIRQNGERVYRIHVPPGPFVIRDFNPPNDEGNLELTIQESDGTERVRVLPYALMPNLVQHRRFSYELTGGRFKPYHGVDMDKDRFWQSTLSWGAWTGVTLFIGMQQGERYLSQLIGAGSNLGAWGALSVDTTLARYRQRGETLSGSAWRLRYARAFLSTETSLSAQLRYFPRRSEYRTLEEKISRAQMLQYDWDDDVTQRRLQGQLELNQNIGEDSSINLSWRWMRARGRTSGSSSLTLSANMQWKEVDISLYGGYERPQGYPEEATLGINISIPLSFGNRMTNVGYVSELASHGKDTHGVNVYGSALKDYSLRYDVTAQHEVHGNDELNASLGYQYNAGEANLSMTRGGGQRDWHADASGSVVLHSGGVTLGQTLGGTSALVEVPNTPGVSFYNQFGATTNRSGEMLVSYMTPWRVNRLTVDNFSLPEGLRFERDELEAVPTDGAIVRVRFKPPASGEEKSKRPENAEGE